MKKIRIGNDFVFNWAIERGGMPEDLSSVLEAKLTASVFGKKQDIPFTVSGNIITIEFTPEICNVIGSYNLLFTYILPDLTLSDDDRKCAVDVDAFQIVAKTAQADDSTEFSMTSDMAIALKGEKGDKGDKGDDGFIGSDGKSAYEIALEAGFEGTKEEWLLSLKGNDGTISFEELTPEQKLSLKGETGAQGIQGEKGEKGDIGVGLPIGGSAGQQLMKKSNVDYDFEWQTPEGAGDMLKSVYDSDGNGIVDNAEKVNGFTVETNVPANAKFTDTVYTHPETHPASIILQNASNRFVSDAEKLAWNDKVDNSRVLTDVPANAKFTDTTYENATTSVSGLMSDTDKSKLDGVEAGANKYVHPAGTNPHGTTKSDVGLGNVDNVKQIPFSEKGANNGVAELDSIGKVLSSQLPSYVDDVLEYATLANFPATGETGKIYISINTNLTYRWTGTAYTEISPSIALGETSSTAYRGDRGKIAYDHSQTAHAPANAQKNSDITKAEIEAKLTGDINTHTHNQYIESSKFQVVESLPASPATGVFYFVKE